MVLSNSDTDGNNVVTFLYVGVVPYNRGSHFGCGGIKGYSPHRRSQEEVRLA